MFSSLDLHHYLDALVFGLRRPPGWCESFDGCMSKLPEASVGAATGSCGLPDAMVGDAASGIKNPGFSGFYPSDPNGHIPVRSSL